MRLEQTFYNRLIGQLQQQDPPGYSFSSQIQKEIFSGVFIEDPQLMSDFIEYNLKQIDEASKSKTKKEQFDALFSFMSSLLEVKFVKKKYKFSKII